MEAVFFPLLPKYKSTTFHFVYPYYCKIKFNPYKIPLFLFWLYNMILWFLFPSLTVGVSKCVITAWSSLLTCCSSIAFQPIKLISCLRICPRTRALKITRTCSGYFMSSNKYEINALSIFGNLDNNHISNKFIHVYFNLLVLFYADYCVILADSAENCKMH